MPAEPPNPALPASLAHLRCDEDGRAWLASLPDRLAACAARWSLRIARPYGGSHASLALPATGPDGTRAVLKLQFPDRESEHEAAALAHWRGDGAIRLLAHDPSLRALLVERCEPGDPLSAIEPAAALGVFVGLLPRLWRPAAGPFGSLAGEAAGWAERLPARWERAGRPFERRLLDTAVGLLRELGASQGEQVLLHQDLHAGNVLRAGREPWLVIDPKPLAGERAFGIAPIVRGAELGHSAAGVRHRLDRLSDELGLDRERARGWTIGQTVAWGFEHDRVLPRHVEVARWLLAPGRTGGAPSRERPPSAVDQPGGASSRGPDRPGGGRRPGGGAG